MGFYWTCPLDEMKFLYVSTADVVRSELYAAREEAKGQSLRVEYALGSVEGEIAA